MNVSQQQQEKGTRQRDGNCAHEGLELVQGVTDMRTADRGAAETSFVDGLNLRARQIACPGRQRASGCRVPRCRSLAIVR